MQVKITNDTHQQAIQQLLTVMGNPNGKPGTAVNFLIERYCQLAIQQLMGGHPLPPVATPVPMPPATPSLGYQPPVAPVATPVAQPEEKPLKNSDIMAALLA